MLLIVDVDDHLWFTVAMWPSLFFIFSYIFYYYFIIYPIDRYICYIYIYICCYLPISILSLSPTLWAHLDSDSLVGGMTHTHTHTHNIWWYGGGSDGTRVCHTHKFCFSFSQHYHSIPYLFLSLTSSSSFFYSSNF